MLKFFNKQVSFANVTLYVACAFPFAKKRKKLSDNRAIIFFIVGFFNF
jgi:hypothetical protein